jgi:hypothetical protein
MDGQERHGLKMVAPAVVDFPLRGEWNTPNTPGEKIPSHGTDFLAQTYAIDFVGLDPDSPSMKFKTLVSALPPPWCAAPRLFCWGKPIYPPPMSGHPRRRRYSNDPGKSLSGSSIMSKMPLSRYR